MELNKLYDYIIHTLKEKKAKDIKSIDISELTTVAEYFIVCSGTSIIHIKTLADELEYQLKEIGVKALRREGYHSARWILMDYGDIIVHIFHEEDREYYNLERLWQDGKIILQNESQ